MKVFKLILTICFFITSNLALSDNYLLHVGQLINVENLKSYKQQSIRIEDKLGSIKVGKLTDLVAVDGNPLEDISLMESIFFIMKDGVIVKQ